MTHCPHCGYESIGRPDCPLCGTRLAEMEGHDAVYAGAPATAMAPASLPAWEDGTTPFPANWFHTLRASWFEPERFFRGVPWEAPLARPLLYYVVLHIALAGAVVLLSLLGFNLFAWFAPSDELGGVNAFGGQAMVLVNFFVAPIGAVLGLFVWAGILHLFVLMLIRERRGFGATARVVCYASGPVVLGLIPFIGSFIGWIWMTVLSVIGLRAAHRTTTGRAAAVILIPYAILFLFVMAAIMMVGLTLLSAFGGAQY